MDMNDSCIICAGSTCTSFAQRHQEHSRGAKLELEKSRESVLYSSYPHDSIKTTGALSALKRGKWSDLRLVTGIRWAKHDVENVVKLFQWDQSIIRCLVRSNVRGALLDKQERMVAYLFETVLGLCIASVKNISSNPSFECFNGRFNG